MTLSRFFVSSIVLLGVCSALSALPPDEPQPPQRRALEAKRHKLNREIKNASVLLNQAMSQRRNTASEYALIQKQVRMRQEAVAVIRQSIDENETRTARAEHLIEGLEAEMLRLQAEQASMMRASYRFYRSNSALFFLFAADGFNDAYRRWAYLRRYNDYCKRQVAQALETKQSLEEQKSELANAKSEKTQLLAEEQQHTTALAADAKAKNNMVKALSNKEADLRAEVDRLERQRETLNSAIETAIRSSIKASDNSSTKSMTMVLPKLSATEKVTDASFSKNVGKLSAPVANGVVIDRFGKHPHPNFPSLSIMNNGITYRTSPNASVKAVFEGRVNAVNYVTGNDYYVLIEHGSYYTSYSQMSSVSVKKGDKVTLNQVIGEAGRNGTLHFEIWHGTQKINPEAWVR